MARKAGPSDEDYDSAARLGLLGLTAGEDAAVDSIMERLAGLHPRNNTFPAEVLLELAAEAIEESGRHRRRTRVHVVARGVHGRSAPAGRR